MSYVTTEPCIGTKDISCVEVCPVDAIHSEDQVPRQWTDYIARNAAHFRDND